MSRRNADAYERFQRVIEWPMIVLAFAVLPLTLAPLVFDLSESAQSAVEVANWIIWVCFVLEYVSLFALAPDRREMIRAHVLDLVIIVLPTLRPLRALRGLRLVRSLAALGRATEGLRRVHSRPGFQAFLGVAFVGVVVGGFIVWAFEHGQPDANIETVPDGIWWAIVTTTTVGYGDYTPITAEGRMIAGVLMFVGIGVLSVVTANVAAYFIETDEDGTEGLIHQLEQIQVRLDQIEAHLGVQSPSAERPPDK